MSVTKKLYWAGQSIKTESFDSLNTLFDCIKEYKIDIAQDILDTPNLINIKNKTHKDIIINITTIDKTKRNFYIFSNLLKNSTVSVQEKIQLMKKLVSYGYDINCQDTNNLHLISFLLLSKDVLNKYTLFKALVELKINPDPNLPVKAHYTSPLISCVKAYSKYLPELIKAGADVNYIDGSGESALSVAVKSEKKHLAGILINNGANIHWLSQDKKTNLLNIILSKRYNPTKNPKQTFNWRDPSLEDKYLWAKWLISRNFNLNKQFGGNSNYINLVLSNNYIKHEQDKLIFIKLFVENGINYHKTIINDITALDLAKSLNYPLISSYLESLLISNDIAEPTTNTKKIKL